MSEMEPAQRKRVDVAMLQSLETWFRMRDQIGWPERHAFNDGDVADLMARMAVLAMPGPKDTP